ncbi:diphthine--ammonia ligase-like isoform X1 [Penaeus chinensis]|uniref:diphthine--ammonia ligase-like isoform X1 n=2 Tax=Penaeus chinensis TaxID=139456 RepID=UPI001FB75E5E|nr:diphthine--ammonia ligase-like isoform X1 [Penaeus chinensis]
MRVVGLVSGGKDSCYNLLQCVAAGHHIVALANLAPGHGDELDSYMYQSVGHMGVAMYAEAVGVPLYRRIIQGSSITTTKTYNPTEGDEVEDLYLLLKEVQEKCSIEAVSVGAVLSDYQRIRVENVCSRLGLVCLAYMWRRDQSELMREMVDCGIDAIIIKVAAIGLEPRKHLGKSISQMITYLEKMKDKYSLNVCGEGGEYETFTLDCPIFRKRIVVKDTELVETSGDVGYLNFTSLELVDKEIPDDVTQMELVRAAGVRDAQEFLGDLKLPEEEQQAEDQAKELNLEEDDLSSTSYQNFDAGHNPVMQVPDTLSYRVVRTTTGFTFAGSFSGSTMDDVIASLKESLQDEEMELHHLISVKMYVQDMNDYVQLNSQYIKHFSVSPPVRVCVEVPLSNNVQVQLDVSGWKQSHVTTDKEPEKIQPTSRSTMHVQGISHWAPANIGPYSQAVKVGSVVVVAGMIGLVPGTLQVVNGGVEVEARLALRHVSRVISAIAPSTDIRAVVQGVCYVTKLSDIGVARRMMARLSESQISTYVVVPALPRAALVEWQTWGCVENDKFEYEEKGYTRGNVSVRLRRRWYHDNSMCAVNTNASCLSPEDLSCDMLEEIIQYTITRADARMPMGLTFYYRCGSISRTLLQQAIVQAVPEGVATLSLVPVLAVEDAHTLLTVSAMRY